MLYVSFDGVICDCLNLDFEKVESMNKNMDSIEVLKKNSVKDAIILVHAETMKEAITKIRVLRYYNVFNDVVIIPKSMKVSDIVRTSVDGKKNLIVDTDICVIREFIHNGGFGMTFGEKLYDICMSTQNLQDAFDFHAQF